MNIEINSTVYPNPSTNEVIISFINSENEQVQLSVFDISGRMISQTKQRTIGRGVNRISWKATDYKVEKGVYFYFLKTEENISRGQFILKNQLN